MSDGLSRRQALAMMAASPLFATTAVASIRHSRDRQCLEPGYPRVFVVPRTCAIKFGFRWDNLEQVESLRSWRERTWWPCCEPLETELRRAGFDLGRYVLMRDVRTVSVVGTSLYRVPGVEFWQPHPDAIDWDVCTGGADLRTAVPVGRDSPYPHPPGPVMPRPPQGVNALGWLRGHDFDLARPFILYREDWIWQPPERVWYREGVATRGESL